jgi:hypothetical protein
VAQAAEYRREHLAKLLAGNCLRFYGYRLAEQLAAHGKNLRLALPEPSGPPAEQTEPQAGTAA